LRLEKKDYLVQSNSSTPVQLAKINSDLGVANGSWQTSGVKTVFNYLLNLPDVPAVKFVWFDVLF
jgi:hypothetical protein